MKKLVTAIVIALAASQGQAQQGGASATNAASGGFTPLQIAVSVAIVAVAIGWVSGGENETSSAPGAPAAPTGTTGTR